MAIINCSKKHTGKKWPIKQLKYKQIKYKTGYIKNIIIEQLTENKRFLLFFMLSDNTETVENEMES